MSIWVILIEMIVFAAIFTAIIFTYYRGDRKYSPASIHRLRLLLCQKQRPPVSHDRRLCNAGVLSE